ncbi:MAG: hypothetical protein JNK04_10875 [Myxococcales bacterium]|nr:hypothetical protein [Myxococcales bacterium]
MIARELAMELGVSERVSFLHRQFGADLTANADAYYLYNPFGENLFQQCHQLDFSVELSERRYSQDVGFVERLLQDAAVGTYLVTFSGFGGLVPRTYEEVRVDWTLPSILRMWKKTSPGSGSP